MARGHGDIPSFAPGGATEGSPSVALAKEGKPARRSLAEGGINEWAPPALLVPWAREQRHWYRGQPAPWAMPARDP